MYAYAASPLTPRMACMPSACSFVFASAENAGRRTRDGQRVCDTGSIGSFDAGHAQRFAGVTGTS